MDFSAATQALEVNDWEEDGSEDEAGSTAAAEAAPVGVLMIEQEGRKSKYLLKKGLTTIGRNPESTIHISDPSVSGSHAQIDAYSLPGGAGITVITVRDLSSSNGTKIIRNNKHISPTTTTPLADEDVLAFGNVRASVCIGAPPPDDEEGGADGDFNYDQDTQAVDPVELTGIEGAVEEVVTKETTETAKDEESVAPADTEAAGGDKEKATGSAAAEMEVPKEKGEGEDGVQQMGAAAQAGGGEAASVAELAGGGGAGGIHEDTEHAAQSARRAGDEGGEREDLLAQQEVDQARFEDTAATLQDPDSDEGVMNEDEDQDAKPQASHSFGTTGPNLGAGEQAAPREHPTALAEDKEETKNEGGGGDENADGREERKPRGGGGGGRGGGADGDGEDAADIDFGATQAAEVEDGAEDDDVDSGEETNDGEAAGSPAGKGGGETAAVGSTAAAGGSPSNPTLGRGAAVAPRVVSGSPSLTPPTQPQDKNDEDSDDDEDDDDEDDDDDDDDDDGASSVMSMDLMDLPQSSAPPESGHEGAVDPTGDGTVSVGAPVSPTAAAAAAAGAAVTTVGENGVGSSAAAQGIEYGSECPTDVDEEGAKQQEALVCEENEGAGQEIAPSPKDTGGDASEVVDANRAEEDKNEAAEEGGGGGKEDEKARVEELQEMAASKGTEEHCEDKTADEEEKKEVEEERIGGGEEKGSEEKTTGNEKEETDEKEEAVVVETNTEAEDEAKAQEDEEKGGASTEGEDVSKSTLAKEDGEDVTAPGEAEEAEAVPHANTEDNGAEVPPSSPAAGDKSPRGRKTRGRGQKRPRSKSQDDADRQEDDAKVVGAESAGAAAAVVEAVEDMDVEAGVKEHEGEDNGREDTPVKAPTKGPAKRGGRRDSKRTASATADALPVPAPVACGRGSTAKRNHDGEKDEDGEEPGPEKSKDEGQSEEKRKSSSKRRGGGSGAAKVVAQKAEDPSKGKNGGRQQRKGKARRGTDADGSGATTSTTATEEVATPAASIGSTPAAKRRRGAGPAHSGDRASPPAPTSAGNDHHDQHEEDNKATAEATATPSSTSSLRRRHSSRIDHRHSQTQSQGRGNGESQQHEQGSSGTAGGETVKVCFTGVKPQKREHAALKRIGATEVDDVTTATHLIAGGDGVELKRTPKLLAGMSVCKYVVDVNWLHESAKAGKALEGGDFILRDGKAEAAWGFDMAGALTHRDELLTSGQSGCLAGVGVLVDPSIMGKSELRCPPKAEMKMVVESAGGKWLLPSTKLQEGQSFLFISHPDAVAKSTTAKKILSSGQATEFMETTELFFFLLRQGGQTALEALKYVSISAKNDGASSSSSTSSKGRGRRKR